MALHTNSFVKKAQIFSASPSCVFLVLLLHVFEALSCVMGMYTRVTLVGFQICIEILVTVTIYKMEFLDGLGLLVFIMSYKCSIV